MRTAGALGLIMAVVFGLLALTQFADIQTSLETVTMGSLNTYIRTFQSFGVLLAVLIAVACLASVVALFMRRQPLQKETSSSQWSCWSSARFARGYQLRRSHVILPREAHTEIPKHYRTRRRRPVSGVAHSCATQLARRPRVSYPGIQCHGSTLTRPRT